VPADGRSIASEIARTRGAVAAVLTLLQERGDGLPDAVRRRLPAITAGLPDIAARADGYQVEEGMPRIRVHGDYHLGQALRTRDDDWVIIDFEGEPARPVSERRQKASPLKDVAGMLRSFGYARGVAERASHSAGGPDAAKRLARWERVARQAFLEEYRRALRTSPVPLAPEDDGAFNRALSAWELDKALYEIAYEARNRPDWLELPLRSLLPEDRDQPAEATGGAPA
jgi:maltose alpha-D-glucosyltransferase/alpha-amylase